MKKIKVGIKNNSYDVVIGDLMISNIWKLITKHRLHKNILFVIDENVYQLHNKKISKILKSKENNGKSNILRLSVKESIKSISYLEKIYSKLITNNYGRDSLIIAIGGGVIGDLAGYAASTFMRGIQLVHVPTTLLSAVDSSVGGKTGINYKGYKNIIGSFYQPKLVIVDVQFLKTLKKDELTSGLGEVIKYSYLSNQYFHNYILKNISKVYKYDKSVLEKIIYNSINIKSAVVTEDEKENGLRKILNLGHTFAHALESYYNYKLKHGQAVILGLIVSLHLSNQLGIINNDELEKHLQLPLSLNLSLNLKKMDLNLLYKNMSVDKKNRNGKIKFVLVKEIGEILLDVEVEKSQVIESLKKIVPLLS